MLRENVGIQFLSLRQRRGFEQLETTFSARGGAPLDADIRGLDTCPTKNDKAPAVRREVTWFKLSK